ncbi:hypothetical protein [Streptomyces sp. NPDC048611]|uniref:hypothetical protein n=1 Tax=Streptomyces sp. NPDC048611 TaxID=3155635 RepID=UPI003421E540
MVTRDPVILNRSEQLTAAPELHRARDRETRDGPRATTRQGLRGLLAATGGQHRCSPARERDDTGWNLHRLSRRP